MWRSWMGWKMPLSKRQTFWIAPWLICYFIVLLFSVEKTWLLMRNLATISPLKYRLSGKFQRFNAIDGRSKCWKIVAFPKWKIVKHFTRPKQQAALKKLFSLPPSQPLLTHQVKSYFFFGIKFFLPRYTEQPFAFKVIQECISWASRKGAVQIFFLKLSKNMFAGKFVKSEGFLAMLREPIIFNIKWVEVRKMSEVFLSKTLL